MKWGARWGGLAAAALVAVAAGCGGSAGDKAGGAAQEHPLVLTLESEDNFVLTGAPEFAKAVSRLSGGSVRVDLVAAGRSTEIDFERAVVEDVRDVRAKLGIVGARDWDTLGVGSFHALLAPFLVDSYELERRVLDSPLAEEMLAGVEQAGVVGVALLPGPLRRPFGVTRALVGPGDYHGAAIGIRPADLANEALLALGSRSEVYVPGDLAGLDGAELDPTTIAFNDYDRQVLTTNVVLWPKPFTIVMNRKAFDALND
jgi:TRAP-type C4-dicarboxylate transport system substrate-binding protein